MIPDEVTKIGDSAFEGCTALTSVMIPASVTSVGETVFNGCTALTDVTCKATEAGKGWNEDWLGDCTAAVTWNAD